MFLQFFGYIPKTIKLQEKTENLRFFGVLLLYTRTERLLYKYFDSRYVIDKKAFIETFAKLGETFLLFKKDFLNKQKTHYYIVELF